MIPHPGGTEVAGNQVSIGMVLIQSLVDRDNFEHTWPTLGTGEVWWLWQKV